MQLAAEHQPYNAVSLAFVGIAHYNLASYVFEAIVKKLGISYEILVFKAVEEQHEMGGVIFGGPF